MRRFSVVAFFVLAYLFSWLQVAFPNAFFSILGVASPTLAAVVTLFILREDAGAQLFKPLFQWRTPPFWALIAIGAPLLLALLAAILINLVSNVPDGFLAAVPWASFPGIFIGRLVVNVWEEIGWRGFALPRLQMRVNGLIASLIIGLLWGGWHLPLYVGSETGQAELPFLLLMANTVLISVVYTWLYNNTRGSLLFVTLFHALINSADALTIGAGVSIVNYFIAKLMVILLVDVVIISVSGVGLSQENVSRLPNGDN